MARMQRDQAVRANLRSATADAHERVDGLFSTFDLTQRQDYGAFLQAQAAALLPLERALQAGVAPELTIDWPSRQRSRHLLDDLAALDLPEPAWSDLPPITRPAEALGTLYVLEGSRLGGALLKHSVPGGYPNAFLAPAPGGAWRAFLEVLENSLTTDDLRNEALAAAERAFTLFEDSARAFARKAA